MSWESIKILIETNMLWLVLALAVGLVVGWMSCAPDKK